MADILDPPQNKSCIFEIMEGQFEGCQKDLGISEEFRL